MAGVVSPWFVQLIHREFPMKITLPGYALIGAVILTAGCTSSQTARIQEKSIVFQALTPKEQKQILAEKVKVGFTSDMVYLALGQPAKVTTAIDPAGATGEEWTYRRAVADPDHIVTGVIDQFPQFRPRDAVHATRLQPGAEAIQRNEGPALSDPTTVFTLQIRFLAGKVVWMKLT